MNQIIPSTAVHLPSLFLFICQPPETFKMPYHSHFSFHFHPRSQKLLNEMFRFIKLSTLLPKFIKAKEILKVFEASVTFVKLLDRDQRFSRKTSTADTNIKKRSSDNSEMLSNILSFICLSIYAICSLILYFLREHNLFIFGHRSLFFHFFLVHFLVLRKFWFFVFHFLEVLFIAVGS